MAYNLQNPNKLFGFPKIDGLTLLFRQQKVLYSHVLYSM